MVIKKGAVKNNLGITRGAQSLGICVREDGFIWASEGSHSTQDTILALFDSTGQKVGSITVPNAQTPNFKNGATVLDLLIDSKGVLWISDFTQGLIYRFTKGKTISPADVTSAKAEVFFRPATPCQVTGIAIDGEKLWVLNPLNGGELFSLDTTASTVPVDRRTTIALKTGPATLNRLFVENNQLWFLNYTTGLCTLPVTATDASGITTYPVPSAVSFTVNNHIAWLAVKDGTRGTIWQKNLNDSGPAVHFATLDGKATLSHLDVDAAGFVWAIEAKSNGSILAISRQGELFAEYTLDNNAWPGQVQWSKSTDTLVVADRAYNSRVITLDLAENGIPPVNPVGKASYTIEVNPGSEAVSPGEKFPDISFKALSTAPATKNKELTGIRVAIIQADNGANTTLGTTSGELPLTVKDLWASADSPEGKVTLSVIARGYVGHDLFTGNVGKKKATRLSFSPRDKHRTLQGFPFAGDGKLNVRFNTDALKEITVKLVGPVVKGHSASADIAVFNEATTPTQDSVSPHDAIAEIKAGKNAGIVTITASVDGLSDSMEWEVVPLPAEFNVLETALVANGPGWQNTIVPRAVTLSGYEVLGDSTSAKLPVKNFPLKITVGNAASGFIFKSSKKNVLETVTDNIGSYMLDFNEMDTPQDFPEQLTVMFQYAADFLKKEYVEGKTMIISSRGEC